MSRTREGELAAQNMAAKAEEVALLLKTLSHPARLMIVCTLVDTELAVGELEAMLELHQPHLSQHLTVLRAARIVEPRRAGKQIYYRLTQAKAAELVGALHAIFCRRPE
ncbi:ArsR/SmtB family transcription factor [Xaviernesmea oryzae]|nr:metalloregulator ArsR/SmtB family transcription factor [Xaviernesmea oryzae]SEL06415.1 ArsR family transcriptional regulator [Xaviernesmea oryzae]